MILVPEAINPERVISYAMQNRSSNPVHPAILVSTLRELLVMPCKIVAVPGDTGINPERVISYAMQNRSSNPGYPAILVLDAINPGRAISYARQNRTPN